VAEELAHHERIALLCGRYEGVDERIREHLVNDEISVGDYVLTGGEIPMQFRASSPECWGTRQAPKMTHTPWAFWNIRTIRVRLSSVIGKYRTFCFREITLRSKDGAGNRH
jgi:hypothetical protein